MTPQTTHPILEGGRLGRRSLLTGAGGAAALAATGLLGGADALARPLAGPRAAAAAPKPLDLLRRMIGFDTQNFGEGGKTRAHAEWLKGVWDGAGVPSEIIPTPQPDNVHLIARIKGTSSARPLLLLGHSDVVPVERENWSVDPFAAVVEGGEIYGRGALDMKGANAATVAGLLRHVQQGHRFERDVIVLTDCDEEAGQYGSGWLAENHWDKLDAGMVLTEGGWFLAQSNGRTPMLVTVTRQDKVYFNLDLYASGTATHSSKPIPDSAIVSLSRAVADIGDDLAPVHLTAVTREYFSALARATDDRRLAGAIRLMLGTHSTKVRERAASLVVKYSDYPYLHSALLRTTAAFVIEDAGYKENVIPSEAHVRVNCRGIPGGEKPRDFVARLRKTLRGKDIEVRLGAPEGTSEADYLDQLDETWATAPASLDTPLFHAIERAAQRTYPGAVFSPALFEAGTSLGPWRERGIPGYGVYPYVIDDDQLIGMHGNDERIYVDALERGTDFMYRVFDGFRA
ncbi:M20/M25/M40 family metallo-hydrolase [Phycicoccus sonneratiae]|uniref:M20/M25/M40 family metallo-hydrolase n=1 Tax=Phycicoccus sonneratiae TaxID=2807628 RepID=A0ABS2CP00_9MICO|nr:M20/M25/M40 family metallo-hydrolase [Phycicoccus sonneraticus]MBM6401158.1 M20/M25/M40 family metallo-hydrolase [Phycicoccus sonneraticus]